MKLEDIPEIYRMAFSVYEAYRRLGIPGDDIKIGYEKIYNAPGFIAPPEMLFVRAHQGELEFVFTIGPVPGKTRAEVLADLTSAVPVWVDPENHQLVQKIWEDSLFAKESAMRDLIFHMARKGFRFVNPDDVN